MTIKAAAGRDGALGHGQAMGIINDLQRIGSSLKQAVVKGRPTRDDPLDKIDLVSERVAADPNLPLSQGRRYSRQNRWGALSDTLNGWLTSGVLT